MHHHTSSGPVQVPARVAAKAAQQALKTLLTLIDARYQALPSLGMVPVRTSGLAQTLANVAKAAGGPTLASIESQIEAIDRDIDRQLGKALSLLAAADHHAAFLRSAADHIEHGTALAHVGAAPADLIKAAAVMRLHHRHGDLDGQAKEVAAVLRQQADAAAHLLPAADYCRKYRTTVRIAQQRQKGLVYAALASAVSRGQTLEIATKAAALGTKARSADRAAKAFHAGYAKAYLGKRNTRRPPALACLDVSRIQRTEKGFSLGGTL